MLKLERISHHSQIQIFVRDKESFFTQHLLIGLSTAIFLHLIIILLFHVSPIKIRWNHTLTSPVFVETDLGPPNSLVLANLSPPPQKRSSLVEFKPLLPSLQKSPYFFKVHPIEYFKEQRTLTNPFSQMEKEIYQPSFSPAIKTAPQPLIKIVISGPLANKKILGNGLTNDLRSRLLAIPEGQKRFRTIYSVAMEGRSGQIIWYEPKEKLENKEIIRFTEEILEDLRVEPEASTFVTSGEIEVHFNLEAP